MKRQRIDIRQSKNAKSGLHQLCQYLETFIDMDIMVEVGTFAGNSTEIFLQYFKHIICIDPWKSKFDENDTLSNPNKFNMEEVYNQFKEYVVRKYAENITIYRSTSREVIDYIDNELLDFVYIDGNHQEEFIRDDIKLWYPKVKRGGFIGGHDYYSKRHPHIQKVIKENFDNIITFKDTSWITRKE